MAKAYLEPKEIEQLERAATNLRDKLLIRFLFKSANRISEALAIGVGDIDFIHKTVTIQHLKIRLNLSCPNCGARLSKSHKFCPSCSNSVEKAIAQAREHRRVRTLPIDDETLQMLKGYIKRGGAVTQDGKKLLFCINRHRAWQIVKECAEKAGLPKLLNPETGKLHHVSPHKLRDAFAVNAIKIDDSGDGLRMLQEHLGHQSFNTTAKYRKVAGEELRDWYEKLWNNEVKKEGNHDECK
jgi:integrase/recombinase XerD